jgi:hypothetical protein
MNRQVAKRAKVSEDFGGGAPLRRDEGYYIADDENQHPSPKDFVQAVPGADPCSDHGGDDAQE